MEPLFSQTHYNWGNDLKLQSFSLYFKVILAQNLNLDLKSYFKSEKIGQCQDPYPLDWTIECLAARLKVFVHELYQKSLIKEGVREFDTENFYIEVSRSLEMALIQVKRKIGMSERENLPFLERLVFLVQNELREEFKSLFKKVTSWNLDWKPLKTSCLKH